MMNTIISNVLARKQDIINNTMEYENLNKNHIPHDHVKEYVKLYNFFNDNFNDDEIMVVQSIMYFGRDCFPNGNPEYNGNIEEVIEQWMKNLFFSFGKKINKEIEIDQMVGKGLKIGTYFKLAFEYFEKNI